MYIMCISVLDVSAFERLLGPCMDVMKRNIDDYEEKLIEVFGSKVKIRFAALTFLNY